MKRQNRTSVGNFLSQSSEREQSKEQRTIPSPQSIHSICETKPVHMILQQYIRQSAVQGSVRATFKDYSEKEEREAQKVRFSTMNLQDTNKDNGQISLSQIEAVSITRMGIRNFESMENQDVIMEDRLGDRCRFYGIFDGHGQHGRDLALTAKKIFQSLIQKHNEDIKSENSILSMQDIVKRVLQKTNAYLLHYKPEEAKFSGTTALIVAVTVTQIFVFNIGNSRLVLGRYYENSKKMEAFQVTHDHTLDRFDERLRITKSGGVIAPFKNQLGQFFGPQRIWAPNDKYPGIIVTRTMGLSCSYPLGVISQPEINVLKYRSCYKFLVLASDGLWTVQDNDEVVTLLAKSHPRSLTAHASSLILQALKRWRDREEMMDDVSMIVIPLVEQ